MVLKLIGLGWLALLCGIAAWLLLAAVDGWLFHRTSASACTKPPTTLEETTQSHTEAMHRLAWTAGANRYDIDAEWRTYVESGAGQ